MNLEVFLFGASNNGAVTHPNTDSAYFEGYFFQTAKEEERGKPIMDVRIREKEGHTYVDYSILLNGLASVSETKEVGRYGANVGTTYRLEGFFPDFERAYHLLVSEFRGAIYGTLLDKEGTKFLRTIDEFKKLPGTLEQRGVRVGEEAANILISRVEGFIPPDKIEKRIVRTKLIIRGTTR